MRALIALLALIGVAVALLVTSNTRPVIKFVLVLMGMMFALAMLGGVHI